jgi:hypothetical protein
MNWIALVFLIVVGLQSDVVCRDREAAPAPFEAEMKNLGAPPAGFSRGRLIRLRQLSIDDGARPRRRDATPHPHSKIQRRVYGRGSAVVSEQLGADTFDDFVCAVSCKNIVRALAILAVNPAILAQCSSMDNFALHFAAAERSEVLVGAIIVALQEAYSFVGLDFYLKRRNKSFLRPLDMVPRVREFQRLRELLTPSDELVVALAPDDEGELADDEKGEFADDE